MNDHIVLSIYEGHMASSCLMINGKVISAAHEERFSRIKCDVGFPFQAINYCIKYAGIEYSQIDKVVLSNLDFNKNGIANLMFKRPALYSIDDWIYENNIFNVRYQVKPFMIWIWVSTLLIIFGGFVRLIKIK